MWAERARTATTEIALLLAYPAVLAAWVASALILGGYGTGVMTIVALVVWPFVCLSGFAGRDPLGFASLALPSAGIGLIGLFALAIDLDPSPLLLGGAAWVLLWTLGGRGIWPWWSRSILRRDPRGSAEAGLLRAWHEIVPRWKVIRTESDSDAVWRDIRALDKFETERTAPVITGILALWDLAFAPGTTPQAFERTNARLNEEWDRLFAPPQIRIRLPFAGTGARADRPTRGMWLDYAYPRAEALVAVAAESHLREIAVESARRAARAAGVAAEDVERALDLARQERGDQAPEAGVDALGAPADHDESSGDRSRRLIALSAVGVAITPKLTRVDTANAVSEAIRSERDASAEADYVRLIAEIIGPETAAKATPLRKPGLRNEADAGAAPVDDLSIVGSQAMSVAGLGRLIAIAAAAGFAGTVLQQGAWDTVAKVPDAASIDGLLGVAIVGVIAHAIIRVWLGRPHFLDVLAIYVASAVSSMLVRPLSELTSLLARPVIGDGWAALFADPENIAPLAPFRAIAFAAALTVAALLLRPANQILRPAAASIEP
jgi:hypothetical protein